MVKISKKKTTIGVIISTLFMSQVFLMGCEGPVDKIVKALDDAINAIEKESQSWQKTLFDLSSFMAKEAQETIKNEIDTLLQRAIGATTTSVVCVLDYIPKRIVDGLKRIKADYLGQSYPAVTPHVCNCDKSELDLSLYPDKLKSVNWYGYDFLTDDFNNPSLTFKVILQEDDGTEYDVTDKVGIPSNYNINVLIGGINGVQLNEKSKKLIIRSLEDVDLKWINVAVPDTMPKVQHELQISGSVVVQDYDPGGFYDSETFSVDWNVELTEQNPTAQYQTPEKEWCVDEVRGELYLVFNLNPNTGTIWGYGLASIYEAGPRSCGGNDLEMFWFINYEIEENDSWNLYGSYFAIEDSDIKGLFSPNLEISNTKIL